MQSTSLLRQHARSVIAALLLLPCATDGFAADTYSAGQLSIPSLSIGNGVYSDVVVTPGSILGVAGGAPNGARDNYNPFDTQLTIPDVTVGTHSYANALVTVGGLVSIGSATGVDTYSGGQLTIPSVQIQGGAQYSNVVINVGTIISPGGGMPANVRDVYDPATKRLTVAAAKVGSKVYTNAIVTVAKVDSVGGVAATQLVTEHALAQTGLAIALASTVLQSQLLILSGLGMGLSTCATLNGGGSVMSGATAAAVTVYYDNACTKPYIVANATATIGTDSSGGAQEVAAETATYYGLAGTVIGTLTLNETLSEILVGGKPSSAVVHGLGVFMPTTGVQTPVQLGLYCTIPASVLTSSATLPCAGGIAQDFPALGMAIGAVTPLTLIVESLATGGPVTFSGTGSTVNSGALGSLILTAPSATSMAITGGTTIGSYVSSGGAAAFALFPPTPTSWTLADPASGLQLQISVLDNVSRNLSVTITQPSFGTTLATGAVDQSGTGAITFSDRTVEAVTSWTLGGNPS
jgi:hypothetical protein